MKRAIFLDKDGPLIENVSSAADGGRIRLRPRAVDALLLLSGLGYELVVASNQPGVALGQFPRGALLAVEEHLKDLFLAHGLSLAACYWCPHHPEGVVPEFSLACTCRKPKPGLLYAAASEHGIDLSASCVVGGPEDLGAAQRAGCRAFAVGDGHGDLLDAATAIMQEDHGASKARRVRS